MTENEKMLIERQEELLDFTEKMLYYAKSKNNEKCIKIYSESKKVSETIIKALEELEQYRAIGTVEECRETREKQRSKKPIIKPFYEDMEEEYLCCPTCGDILTDRIPVDNKDFYFHCLNCGQKLDWSD